MKILYKILTAISISAASSLSIVGCSQLLTSGMPNDGVPMQQAYTNALGNTDDDGSGADSGSLNNARAQVIKLQEFAPHYSDYTRTTENEINSQFPQLPNPSIVMYIFPHQAGQDYSITPIPGYSTVFPLYTQVYYAMPGEISS
ncbi:MAG: TIGR03751 family conjugal transfer lipoprotein [Gammaproteobacteria bacterium]|nr:TIGR03751 family conjugal transfer lipoprotein [Gammaproteobacteria bacterium]